MEINDGTIALLVKYSIPISSYLVLYCIANDLNWHKDIGEDRIGTYQFLTRRGFITSDFKVTKAGEDLLSGQLVVTKKKKALNSNELMQEWQTNFAEFWNLYPTSDKFRHWERTRSLRINKLKAFKYFCDILSKGEYKYSDLKSALLSDIKAKQDSSIMENQFKYMQAITTWLSKGIFEGYICENTTNPSTQDDRTILE